jgi:hypothetical protein
VVRKAATKFLQAVLAESVEQLLQLRRLLLQVVSVVLVAC